MTGKITELNEENFDSFIKDGSTVVDFWAPWCGPCKMMGPIFEAAANSVGKVKFGKLNVEDSGIIAHRYGVMSIPTLIFFKDGKIVDRAVGLMQKEAIEKRAKEL